MSNPITGHGGHVTTANGQTIPVSSWNMTPMTATDAPPLTAHPDYTAFITAICTNPTDDTVRLVLADWLEEHGDGERAEFIRCQVELARGCDPWCRSGVVQQPIMEYRANAGGVVAVGQRDVPCPKCGLLRNRERELVRIKHAYWAANLGFITIPRLSDKPLQPCNARYRRGFITDLCVSATDWIRHADAISWHPTQSRPCPATAMPIVAVTFSAVGNQLIEEMTPGVTGPLRLRGGRKWCQFESLRQDVPLVKQLAEADWPWITFTLPDEPPPRPAPAIPLDGWEIDVRRDDPRTTSFALREEMGSYVGMTADMTLRVDSQFYHNEISPACRRGAEFGPVTSRDRRWTVDRAIVTNIEYDRPIRGPVVVTISARPVGGFRRT